MGANALRRFVRRDNEERDRVGGVRLEKVRRVMTKSISGNDNLHMMRFI